jgi:hypothetical protein
MNPMRPDCLANATSMLVLILRSSDQAILTWR